MISLTLGVDTSNYTTSLALCSNNTIIAQTRRLLPVDEGKCGLRQSEALFAHTKALPILAKELFESVGQEFKICAVGYSGYPRDVQGSYMPCFLAGQSFASAVAYSGNVPLYCFSHQAGHIRAALHNKDNLEIMGKDIISFHISGGTSEIVYVSKSNNRQVPFDIKILGGSDDLNAGQAIDRIGVKLGFDFPCGIELDKLSMQSNKHFKPKACVRGFEMSFSGLQNKCEKMLEQSEQPSDVARFLFSYISCSIIKVCQNIRQSFPDVPILFAGGVMSNTLIRNTLFELDNVYFALPELSRDNACGIALMANEMYQNQ